MPNEQNLDYLSIARARWPSYTVTGAGGIAVVLHCRKLVVLVGLELEARQLVADSCGVVCRLDENRKMHAGYYLLPRKETPHRSMRRLPGWDD